LRKPYFGVPIRKQFEQVHNAYFLRESGVGEFSLDVTKDEIEKFLSSLANYQNRFAEYRNNSDEQKETLLKILDDIKAIQSFSRK
jgi:Glycosyl transferase family 1